MHSSTLLARCQDVDTELIDALSPLGLPLPRFLLLVLGSAQPPGWVVGVGPDAGKRCAAVTAGVHAGAHFRFERAAGVGTATASGGAAGESGALGSNYKDKKLKNPYEGQKAVYGTGEPRVCSPGERDHQVMLAHDPCT